MDFNLTIYVKLLESLLRQGVSFSTLNDHVKSSMKNQIILRHDVDLLPQNSLKFARIQSEIGIKGSYYFRIVPESFDENIIKEISKLGHEIGYHYEDLSFAWAKLKAQGAGRRAKGSEQEETLVNIAIKSFEKNLEKLRKIVTVKTICMHGSPMSRWDSRLLWKYYDYRDYGIVGEPYFDVNFDEVLYLTDTGRRWNGNSFNVRDKASGIGRQATGKEKKRRIGEEENGREENRIPQAAYRMPFPKFHSTFDIIKAADAGNLPDKIMMTFHPQRWTDKPVPWVKELVWQNVKNVGKFFLVKVRS